MRDLRGKKCLGEPVNPTQAARWRKLVAGKHPVTGLATGLTPRPLTMEEWKQWTCDVPEMQLEATQPRAVDVAAELGEAGRDPIVLSLLGAHEGVRDGEVIEVSDASDDGDAKCCLLDESDESVQEFGWPIAPA